MADLPRTEYPIWQAPIGSLAGPELASAVSIAGGIGALALTWTDPRTAAEHVKEIRNQTSNPFQVNFALAFEPLSLEAALDAGAPIVTFSWGNPESYLARVRQVGALVGIQVTSPAGAKRAIELGADFLVCQGVEAGGHVQSSTPLYELLPAIVDCANGLPVIAAGGLTDRADIAQILKSGAHGAMLGTRFVATKESRAHDDYKRLLVASQGPTALTVCFDGDWPYSPHRVLKNSTFSQWEANGCPTNGNRPGEGEETAHTTDGEPILRYNSAAPKQGYEGEIEAMCLYAGTGVSKITDIPSAAELVTRLCNEIKIKY